MNKVILIGRTTADIELKTLSNENVVTNFCLAVDRDVSKDGEKETDFIDITAWNKTAEFLAKYIAKGRKIAIEGRLRANLYEDKEGKKRKSTVVVANRVEFADGKPSAENIPKTTTGTESASLPDGYDEIGDDEDLPF
uniref:Single-stranded DNA-binding protein n=1 Tax=Siphoviridae sp. ct0uL16 TaxID=2825299 RepID=A0A8S5Q5D0_9CAUD|nr:MAG TPA: Single strand binding protein [Siphoviridae sp. ct0uL16]